MILPLVMIPMNWESEKIPQLEKGNYLPRSKVTLRPGDPKCQHCPRID